MNVPLHKRRMKIRAYCPNMYTLWLHIKSTYFTAIVSVFRSAIGSEYYIQCQNNATHMIFFCIQWLPFICLRDRALRFSFEKNFDLRRPTVMTFCWLQSLQCKPSISGVKRTVREDLYIQGTFYSISSYSTVYIRLCIKLSCARPIFVSKRQIHNAA